MAVTQYIGARYVPLFADPLQWDENTAYEPLTIVYDGGNSYTSRQYVPAGTPVTNTDFWALTGNYNAQIEQYRDEVQTLDAVSYTHLTLPTIYSVESSGVPGILKKKKQQQSSH